ncbi:hypothetical protein SCOR_02485 [Sulfidibacter corallicola]|uniref:Uncharacterized protein n=1 Tax=Sulfidibacter corallicola TaxID=2818388 RepID=A0A8A4TF77_SULCO|nr:hypothetical protein [Sulfidibacter corallicola]QTD48606.1 hypothetical protein J3U87_23750 [Sulfidibacter corallicola]
MKKHAKPAAAIDRWMAVRALCSLLILVPNGFFILQPILAFLQEYAVLHGWLMALYEGLPSYFQVVHRHMGSRLWLSGAQLVLAFLLGLAAAKSLQTLVFKLFIFLGVGIQAHGGSHLLHPNREAK